MAGKTQFSQGKQYQIINDVNSKVQWMMANTDSPEAKVKLDVILRTMQTLTQNVDKMGTQIATKQYRKLRMKPFWKISDL